MAARFCGSANVPPPVATTRWRGRELLEQDLPLDAPGSRPRRASRRCRRPSGARAARSARRCRPPASRAAWPAPAPRVVLPARHEADEVDLVGLHAHEPLERLEEIRDTRWRPTSAPSMRRRAARRRARRSRTPSPCGDRRARRRCRPTAASLRRRPADDEAVRRARRRRCRARGSRRPARRCDRSP